MMVTFMLMLEKCMFETLLCALSKLRTEGDLIELRGVAVSEWQGSLSLLLGRGAPSIRHLRGAEIVDIPEEPTITLSKLSDAHVVGKVQSRS